MFHIDYIVIINKNPEENMIADLLLAAERKQTNFCCDFYTVQTELDTEFVEMVMPLAYRY